VGRETALASALDPLAGADAAALGGPTSQASGGARDTEDTYGGSQGRIDRAGPLATAVLDKSSPELQEALLAVLWERKQPELYARALEEVRQAQQEAEATRQERWQAQKAQERRALETEAEQLIAEGISQGMADERQDFEERRQRLISQRDEARARADRAEAWIIDHLKALLPDGRRVLLRNSELTKFRLHTVNLILTRLGYEIRARLTDTPQLVATEVGPSHWEQKSRFRLTTIVPGVMDEMDDEDTSAPVEASQGGTQAG
jgi:hypothetical protein